MSFEVSSATVAGTESQPSRAPSNLSYTSPAVSYSITSTRSLGIPSCEVFKIHRQSPPAQPSKKDALALLSPPTRPKRFIQMKPRRQREEQQQQPKETPTKRRLSSIRAADRKITRNKAHSLVEQRRRVKMNETFAIMKDMIPACTGDMHKLDILQASIDYMQYLEDCVEKLQSEIRDANGDNCATSIFEQTSFPRSASSKSSSSSPQDPIHQEDVETAGPESPSPPTSSTSARCSTLPTATSTNPTFSPTSTSETDLDQDVLRPPQMVNLSRDHTSVIRKGLSVRDLLT